MSTLSDNSPSLRMVMLGKTGSGKSSLGNTILRRDVFNTEGLSESTTTRIQRKRGVFLKERFEVVDTPGVYSTYTSHQETALEIKKALYPEPDVILYVIKLVIFTDEDSNAFKRIKAYFGDDITKRMIVVFTHIEQCTGTRPSLEEFHTEATSNLMRVIGEVGQRCVVVNIRKKTNGDYHEVCDLSMAVERLLTTKQPTFSKCWRYQQGIKWNVEEAEKREVRNTQTGWDLLDQIKQLTDQTEQLTVLNKRKNGFLVLGFYMVLMLAAILYAQGQREKCDSCPTSDPHGTLLS